MVTIKSPNTVLANALELPTDLFIPRLKINQPTKVVFAVGTQINGYPHIGTYLVQAATFVLAKEVRGRFGMDVSVVFGALDNAPYKVINHDGSAYQIDWYHHQGHQQVKALIERNYLDYFEELSRLTGVPYTWSTYYEQQATPEFRSMFLRSLAYQNKVAWTVAPSTGVLKVRIPCPECGYAQKHAEGTQLVHFDEESAIFNCFCHQHGTYQVQIGLDGREHIDLNTLYRNLVKEASFAQHKDTLAVMVKGGDWIYSTQLVDWGLASMGYTSLEVPMRIFTPQILTNAGAKLSKSLIRSGDLTMSEVPEWLLDMDKFRGLFPSNYGKVLIWLITQFLSNPRHFYRSYSYEEIIRLIQLYPADEA